MISTMALCIIAALVGYQVAQKNKSTKEIKCMYMSLSIYHHRFIKSSVCMNSEMIDSFYFR